MPAKRPPELGLPPRLPSADPAATGSPEPRAEANSLVSVGVARVSPKTWRKAKSRVSVRLSR